jgi:organic hydroperoxide reductase OsmC/OhrA
MKERKHHYAVTVAWTGNRGTGTSAYGAYERSHEMLADERPPIAGSSDPAFRGDVTRWNPELLLLAALSACHKLTYLHLCAASGVIVTKYLDEAQAVMIETLDGRGRFERALLRPKVTISAGSDPQLAKSLHAAAHEACFIANSVNFTVEHEATVDVES